jgi:Na+-driven multidrug efflux pump
MGVGMAICLIAPGSLIGLFTTNPATIKAGGTALRIISCGFVVSSISVIVCGTMEALGSGTLSFIISLMRYVVIIVPVAFVLSRFIGATGVWNAFWVAEAVTAVIAVLIYRRKMHAISK